MNINHFPPLPNPRVANPLSRQKMAHAFTLTEILIAIALVVIIAGVSVTALFGLLERGRSDSVTLFFDDAKTAFLAYRVDTGTFPTTEEGLRALIAAPEGVSGWRGPYMDSKDVPADAWHTPYQYAYPGPHNGAGKYDLWSAGPDKVSGTADDIGNW